MKGLSFTEAFSYFVSLQNHDQINSIERVDRPFRPFPCLVFLLSIACRTPYGIEE